MPNIALVTCCNAVVVVVVVLVVAVAMKLETRTRRGRARGSGSRHVIVGKSWIIGKVTLNKKKANPA